MFVFDTTTHSWREKGRGVIRLNDMCQSMTEGIFQSRLGKAKSWNRRLLTEVAPRPPKFKLVEHRTKS